MCRICARIWEGSYMLNFLCTIIKEIKSSDDMMEVGWRGEKRKKNA